MYTRVFMCVFFKVSVFFQSAKINYPTFQFSAKHNSIELLLSSETRCAIDSCKIID